MNSGKRIEFSEKSGVNIITPYGEMAFFFLEELDNFIKEQMKVNNFRFIYDFSNVKWIDSMGLGLIAMSVKMALLNNSRICIVNPRDNIVELLRLSSLFELVNVYATIDEALQFFSTK